MKKLKKRKRNGKKCIENNKSSFHDLLIVFDVLMQIDREKLLYFKIRFRFGAKGFKEIKKVCKGFHKKMYGGIISHFKS